MTDKKENPHFRPRPGGVFASQWRSGQPQGRFRGAGGHADGQPAPPENSEEHGRGVSGRGASAV